MINCFSFNLLSSALGTTDNGRNFPRINTSPVEILSADVSEPPSSQVKLEISKTEKHRNNNILVEEAAQIFDDEIPVQQKWKTPWTRCDTFRTRLRWIESKP